jgi:hypothetical protein
VFFFYFSRHADAKIVVCNFFFLLNFSANQMKIKICQRYFEVGDTAPDKGENVADVFDWQLLTQPDEMNFLKC